VGRVLSTAFCVALLVAAAGAFALTEGAKTQLSPVYGTRIDKVFSPICDPHICAKRVADIRFKLRRRAQLEVWITSEATGQRVATLVSGRTYARGPVLLVFAGRSADGAVLPDGNYLPVVRLVGDLTLTLPNPILIDTKPPRVVTHTRRLPALLAPGAVGEPQAVRVSYGLSAPGHGVLFVDGRRVALTYRQHLHDVLAWKGRIDGRLAPAGRYTLELAVRDEAGNQSRPLVVGHVAVRYLVLARSLIKVRSRARFSVRLLVAPARVRWLLAGRRGVTSSRLLRLRAPKRRGSYRLFVSGGGHAATARVVVS
jgi:hypothetical protein